MTSERRSVAPSGAEELVIADLIEEFAARLQAGESINADSFAAEHPAYAAKLRELLPGVQVLADLEPSRSIADCEDVLAEAREGTLSGTLGDFRIIREVGKGGMGVVYEAEQISLRRRVALKVLPFAATMDSRHLQRFHNEAQAAACLHHTNIVPVFSIGCERGVHFYAMQFIDGQPLSEIIHQLQRAQKPESAAESEQTAAYQPSPHVAIATRPAVGPVADVTPLTGEGRRGRDYYRKVAEVGIQAAEALDHAHQLGIVHRDVKPANLLLDSRGNIWVADFGLAYMRRGEANLTLTGQALGTPRYMSPEQAMAKLVPIDHRTDVYSLGVTLYELLTLRPAFTSEDRHELLRQIAFEEPAKPRRLERDVPAELETIVLKAMEKRPQDRYATAQELADDLRHWLDDRPIRARRPSWAQVVRKWARRHKPAAAASTLVLLMALIMAGYIAWARHDRALRRTASEQAVLAALKDSDDWQEKRRLPEALSAARRAEGLLAGADVGEALQQQVRARLKDLELLERLETVLLEMADSVKDGGRADREKADRLYGQAFRDAGLDVEALPVEEAGERISRSTVAVELAAVLDNWAVIRRQLRGESDPGWRHLFHVARTADADAWRTQIREALERNDRQALVDLAASDEVFRVPTLILYLVASALRDKGAAERAEGLLREAQRQRPDDFGLNANLYFFYRGMQPPQREEMLRFAAVAAALRPGSPGVRLNLGAALQDKGRLDEAIAEYRSAILLKRDFSTAYNNLGNALYTKGQLDEAIGEYKEAIRLKKDYALAHWNLGNVLWDKGRLDEAIAEYREAIRIKGNYAEAHQNLGAALREKGQLDEAIAEFREALKKPFPEAYRTHAGLGMALQDKGRLDEAIAEFREAIRLNEDYAEAHNHLGIALYHKGQLDEAIAAYTEAIRLKKDDPLAHSNLGAALGKKGRLDEAIAEFREAIRLKKDDPKAHRNLGVALYEKGSLDEAIAEFREAIRLKKDDPEANSYLKTALASREVLAKLPAILSGRAKADNPAEQIALAHACQAPDKRLYAAAARFFRDAFAVQPRLADDLNAQHRYNAACAAALAGCGQGADAAKLDAKERARLRQQALDWLPADLKAYRQLMEKSAGKAGRTIAQRMQHWLQDGDFAGVRGTESLAHLPAAERKEWQKLWQEVEALRQRAAQQPKTESSARP